jgi:N-acetylmuramoyl-L-alanine amidase
MRMRVSWSRPPNKKNLMKNLWVIDAGHGGVDAKGNYTTDPKKNKKFTFPDGHTVYEGVINRAIASLVEARLQAQRIQFLRSYDRIHDWSLTSRVNLINSIVESNRGKTQVILLSIHSNAGKGKGFEIFTSPGHTKSDPIAQVFCDVYKRRFPDFPFRSDTVDGDLDKEADYTILTDTRCPALLVENLFFDNRAEADYLESSKGQSDIAGAIVEAIAILERGI